MWTDEQIGQKFLELRTSLNLTQRKAGKIMEVSAQQIQKYETGITKLSIRRYLNFCERIGINPWKAFSEKPSEDFNKDVFQVMAAYKALSLDMQNTVGVMIKSLAKEL